MQENRLPSTVYPLRIAFMGTPDFALEALKTLHTGPHEIVCVYTQPPRPKGRGHKVQPSPTHQYADEHGIPVHHPKSLKSAEEQEIFAAYKPDIAIVAAYGLLLPAAILDAPKFGCINIHASLLPRWRGASPIQHAIWKGDAETGVTLMQMDEGLDTGAMIAKANIPITHNTTTTSLHDELCRVQEGVLADVLERLSKGENLNPEQQNNAQSTYAPLLKKQDGKIDWSQPATEIDHQIRALNPWPGTYTGEGDQRLKIYAATINEASTEKDRPVGMLMDKRGTVTCGDGTAIQILTLQPAGKKAMDFASALNGGYVTIGEILPS